MKNSSARWLPSRHLNSDDEPRSVGWELELTGVTPDVLTREIKAQFDGHVVEKNRCEYGVAGSRYGDFIIELDANYLKEIAQRQTDQSIINTPLENISADLLTQAGELFVPWEVVTPPMPMDALDELLSLVQRLRKQGALGTRNSPIYAFGVHINPELPSLDAETILNYMRAYFCLFDWIKTEEKIDLSRMMSSYIKHFEKNYIKKVVSWSYQPDQEELIDDYLVYNATRNRSFDMLPLFAFLDEKRVRAVIDDPRIKARPTFHYRLPNCDIDNPDWNLDLPWGCWLEVEKLASDVDKLKSACELYLTELNRITHAFEDRWVERISSIIGR